MQATEHEIPIVYGSDLLQARVSGQLVSFPGLRPGQKAPYVLVVELDSTTVGLLDLLLSDLNKGRTENDFVHVALVARGETNDARKFVDKSIQDPRVAKLVHFVLWDDRPSEQQGILEIFWPLYQGEVKGQEKLFAGNTTSNPFGTSQIGMPATILNKNTSLDQYFHRKPCLLMDGKPDYVAPPRTETKESQFTKCTYEPRGTTEQLDSDDDISFSGGLLEPIIPKSRNLSEWIGSTFFPSIGNFFLSDSPFNDERQHNFWFFLKVTLLNAFGFDGYNRITNQITSADGRRKSYSSEELPFWLILASFFGFPTRVETVIEGVPVLTGWQLWRNFFGGLNLFSEPGVYGDKKTRKRFEKRSWEIVALPFKILIIFPLKIVLIPFKTAINILRLFTEILPSLLNYGLLFLVFGALDLIDLVYEAGNSISFKPVFYFVEVLRYFSLILIVLLSVSVAIVQYATMMLNRAALALTSPGRSAELAYALGRSISISWFGEGFETFMSYTFGVIGTLLSLTLSAVLWTMFLPLALGAIGTVIPSITSAITWVSQLPFVTATLSWFSTMPLVNSSVILVNQLFATVGAALVTAFGSAVTTLATLTMVQVPAAVMVVGTTLGLLVLPVAGLLSIAADKLSDFWARWMWEEGGPLTWAFGCFSKNHQYEPLVEMSVQSNSRSSTPEPGVDAKKVVGGRNGALRSADNSVDYTGRTADGVNREQVSGTFGQGQSGQVFVSGAVAESSFTQVSGTGFGFSKETD